MIIHDFNGCDPHIGQNRKKKTVEIFYLDWKRELGEGVSETAGLLLLGSQLRGPVSPTAAAFRPAS